MRKAINDNPVVQIGVIGVLLVVVGLIVMTSAKRGGGEEAASATDTTASLSVSVDATVPDAEATAAAPPPAATTVPPASELTAGPGLPKEVLGAYRDGRTIVLLIVRGGGIEDRAVRADVSALSGDPRLAIFITRASGIARYARITQGVGVERVPALVVIRPRRVSGGVPEARVSYGFREAQSVAQAVKDAVYDGPKRSYHPG